VKMKILWFLALAASAFADAKADLDALQGNWTVTSMNMDGKAAPAEAVQGLVFTVSGDQYKLTDKGTDVETGTVKLGEVDGLKTLDYAIGSGSEKGKNQLGIYKLEGETLAIANSPPGQESRPAKIEAGAGLGYVTLKKGVAPASPAPASPPASAAPAAAPVITGDKAYSPAGDFTLTLPAGWKLAEQPKEGSDIDVDTEDGGDVWVEHVDRDGVEAKPFMDTILANLRKQASKLEEKSRVDVTVAGMKGLRAVVEAKVGENDLVYIFTVVTNEKTLYQITGLAVQATFAEQQKNLNAIADSLKLGK
jgi:uncharacterized protein (TIGR03067 family)